MFKTFIFSHYIAFFCLTSLLLSTKAYSLEVNDLYQASIPVKTQNSQERNKSLKHAMKAVMLKVGGQISVLDNLTLKKAIAQANIYITQYHYLEKQQTIKQAPNGQQSEKQLVLVASFNEDKINELFSQANLPIWGRLRPEVLLWLINEQGLSRTIVSNSIIEKDELVDFPTLVSDFSSQRGLPLLMPLMDFDDVNQISLSDLWGRFEQPIRNASDRYLPEAIVVMRISNSSLLFDENNNLVTEDNLNESNNIDGCGLLCSQKENKYILDWSLLSPQALGTNQGLMKQQKFSQQYKGNSKQALLEQGLSDITEIIYQHYALSTEVNNSVVIDVANIDSLKAYTQLFDFLADLSAVNSVTLISAKGSLRRFRLQLLGSKNALLASLKLNQKLQQYIDPLAQTDNSTVPVFYWDK